VQAPTGCAPSALAPHLLGPMNQEQINTNNQQLSIISTKSQTAGIEVH
jgi:hypothetical protein